jgi:hypothetical protein
MKLESYVVSDNKPTIINVAQIRGVSRATAEYSAIFLDGDYKVFINLSVDEVFDALRGLHVPGVTLIKV